LLLLVLYLQAAVEAGVSVQDQLNLMLTRAVVVAEVDIVVAVNQVQQGIHLLLHQAREIPEEIINQAILTQLEVVVVQEVTDQVDLVLKAEMAVQDLLIPLAEPV